MAQQLPYLQQQPHQAPILLQPQYPIQQQQVVYMQPMAMPVVLKHNPEWHSSLCGCCEAPGTCLVACIVPCFVLGDNAELRGTGDDCFCSTLTAVVASAIGCYCCWAIAERGKNREVMGVNGNCCEDSMAVAFCHPCAATQEHREIKHRLHAAQRAAPGQQQMM